MIDTSLDFSGLLDLSKDLELLSRAESRRVKRDVTRAAATVFKDEAVRRAPRRTGKMARNIVVISQRDRNGEVVSGVHVRGTNPQTGNSDNTMKASNRNNAFYWRFVEMGTSKTAPVPFIRPAYDTKQEEATAAGFAKANEAIDKVLGK